MFYFSNISLETMDTTEDGRILLNPATGEVHMLDFAGNTIYTFLESPHSQEELLDYLCTVFDSSPEEMKPDVESFLADAVSKKILLTHEN